jgi:hypothetical protein
LNRQSVFCKKYFLIMERKGFTEPLGMAEEDDIRKGKRKKKFERKTKKEKNFSEKRKAGFSEPDDLENESDNNGEKKDRKENEQERDEVEEIIEKDIFSPSFIAKFYEDGKKDQTRKDELIEDYSGELRDLLLEKLRHDDFELNEFVLQFFSQKAVSEKEALEMKNIFEETIFEKKYHSCIGEDLWDKERKKCIRILGYDRKKGEEKKVLVSIGMIGRTARDLKTVSADELDQMFLDNDYGFHFSRAAFDHTYHRMKDSSELLNESETSAKRDGKGKLTSIKTETTKEESDKIFLEKTRELWKKFAVHGFVSVDDKGNKTLIADTDLDGKSCLELLKLAGFDTSDVRYVNPGEMEEDALTMDSGRINGVASLNDGKETIFDHHTPESSRFSSAAKFTYEMLTETGLLEKQKYLDEFIKFVTDEDNKTYTESELKEMFDPDGKGKKPFYHKTLIGLSRYMSMDDMLEFFREGKDPRGELDKEYLKARKAVGMDEDGKTLIDASNEVGWKMNQSRKSMREMKKEGFTVDTGQERYGQVIIDTGTIYKDRLVKKISQGFDAARPMGYGGYLLWFPEKNSFKLYTARPMDFDFSQGLSIRGNFWNKPPGIDGPLTVTLEEVLSKLCGKETKIEGKLKEALDKEQEGISNLAKKEAVKGKAGEESKTESFLSEPKAKSKKEKTERKPAEFSEKEKNYLDVYTRLVHSSLDYMENGSYLFEQGYDLRDKDDIETIKKADLKKFWEQEVYQKLLEDGRMREETIPKAIEEIKIEIKKLNRLRAEAQNSEVE